MCRGPRVDRQRLGVSHVGQVRDELEPIHDLATGLAATLDTEAEDAARASLEVLLGQLVARVVLEAGVRHPADVRALLEVPRQRKGVLGMALCSQREGFDPQQKLLRGERVQAGAEVTEDLDTHTDDEGDGAERLPELEPMVAV